VRSECPPKPCQSLLFLSAAVELLLIVGTPGKK